MLLNNLNFSTRYDFNADSLKLKEISVSGGTQLFKQKMNINFAAILDPYAIDNSGKRIEKLNKENFDRIVKTEYKEWMKGNPNTKSIDGKTHSCFSKPTNVKWGDDYLN